jgi:hypothetical protein
MLTFLLEVGERSKGGMAFKVESGQVLELKIESRVD